MTIARVELKQTSGYDNFMIYLQMTNYTDNKITTRSIVEVFQTTTREYDGGWDTVISGRVDNNTAIDNTIKFFSELERDGWNVTSAVNTIVQYLSTLGSESGPYGITIGSLNAVITRG